MPDHSHFDEQRGNPEQEMVGEPRKIASAPSACVEVVPLRVLAGILGSFGKFVPKFVGQLI